ncbi:CaiB/BaiF CoA transferase family protein [Pseudonocardia sp. CA-107938]|uniref:CaiB/BaiF CoA transferase family protein n=1 Tax=Pseudonocardia sp. CA-107938 TaxID=3240021 RepID=UPI003D89BEAB
MTETRTGPRPLAGLRVLDFTMIMSGPFCTRMLADLGAEVIKVEPPAGDQIRGRPPARGDGHSTYFGQLNCGKRSIVLDLRTVEGADVARRLAASSDVVVENYRPGVMSRLGLGYETLSVDNPRLVFCSISGFGQTGPDAGRAAYAPIIHAASGYDMANLQYQDDADTPGRTGIFIADVLGAVYAFGAIQTALLHRERSGVGQFVDVALMDGMLSMLVFEAQEAQFPTERRRPVYAPVRTTDGFVVVAPVSERLFEKLCDVVGSPQWRTDPRFATIEQREQHWDTLTGLVEEWTSRRSAAECEKILTDAGLPCSRYRTVGEAIADPQVLHRGALATVTDPAGEFAVPQQPFRFSAVSVGAGSGVPALGAAGPDILREVLDLDDGAIEALRVSGALGR